MSQAVSPNKQWIIAPDTNWLIEDKWVRLFFTVKPVLFSDKENWDCKMKSFACETLPSSSSVDE